MPAALALTLALASAAPVCGPLDADATLALAAQNADEIAIKKAELAAAQADLSIAKAARIIPIASATMFTGLVPEARGNILFSPDTNKSLSGLGPYVRLDVDVIQPIFTWGRLDAARDAATAGVKARDRLVSDKLSELRVRVAQLFWGETLARRLLAIAADVDKNLKQVDDQLTKLLKEGDQSVKPADRYRLDVYKALLRKRTAEAQKGLEIAHDGLAATVALNPEALVLREAALSVEPGDAPDLALQLERAEHQRPDIAALEAAITARENEVKAAEGAMKPALFLGGTFSFAWAPNRDTQSNPWINDPFNHFGGGVALGVRQDLSFPLLSAQAAKARAETETLRAQRQGASRLVAQQVEQAVSEVKYARERLMAANGAFASGKAWFRAAGLDFEAGVGEPKDLLDAYQAFIEVQVDQLQAAYDLLVARVKLDQAAGVAPRIGPSPCPPPVRTGPLP